jgi:phage-related protein
MGDSRERLQKSPADIRSDVGYQLGLVQRGELPDDFKTMPDVGPGVMEIRIHGDNEYREESRTRLGQDTPRCVD